MRTPEQNAQIVANLENVLRVTMDIIQNKGHYPDEADQFWLDKIIGSIVQGEKLKTFGPQP